MNNTTLARAIWEIACQITAADIQGLYGADDEYSVEAMAVSAEKGELRAEWRGLDGNPESVDVRLTVAPEPLAGQRVGLRITVSYPASLWAPSFAVAAARRISAVADLAAKIEAQFEDAEFALPPRLTEDAPS
jgi:hypothetical protein